MKPQRLRWTPLAVCLGAWGLGAVQAQAQLGSAVALGIGPGL